MRQSQLNENKPIRANCYALLYIAKYIFGLNQSNDFPLNAILLWQTGNERT